MIWFINVFYLSLKELRCVLRDRTMMGAILISFRPTRPTATRWWPWAPRPTSPT